MSLFDTKRVWGPEPNYPNVRNYERPLPHDLITIAGPCSIESEDQMELVAKEIGRVGATFARGGVFRAGTYPREDFGLKRSLMELWAKTARKHGLKTILEVLDVRQVWDMEPYADAFQVGARHMQDYALLKELASSQRVVTLKRNMGATLDEFLGAAEYLARGKCQPVLIERGGSTNLNHVRWDLSISLIAAVKQITEIPILVDASHGTGRRDLVEPMTLAGIAAGADGFLVEVHPDPEKSLSDADQALPLRRYEYLLEEVRAVREAICPKITGHKLTKFSTWTTSST